MRAVLSTMPRHQEHWAFEIKWDGVRAVVFADRGDVRVVSRNHNDISIQFPELLELGAALASHRAVLDGEIVAFDERGRPSFQQLQQRIGVTSSARVRTLRSAVPVMYLAFDIVFLDGRWLTSLPYEQRRQALRELLADGPSWRVPAEVVGDGSTLLAAAARLDLEGVVAKRLGSVYHEGRRHGDWRKVKLQRRQEFVVGGWTHAASEARAESFGSLLIGYHDSDGRLVYAGKVGGGFTDAQLRQLAAKLTALERADSPFDVRAPGGSDLHFVHPDLVVEVEFTELTRDRTLRHPVFKGIRFDKPARDVVLEVAA